MLRTFEKAALEAGRAIITVLREGFPVAMKADASPVTVADEEAERIILAHLARDYPEIPVVAEESVAAGKVPDFKPGDPRYGISENAYLGDQASSTAYTVTITANADGTWSYAEETTLRMTELPEPLAHTDSNTLTRTA